MKWTLIAPLGATAAVAGLTLAVTHHGTAPVQNLRHVQTAAASSDELGAPTFLPSIASLAAVTRDAASGAIVREYALAGKANANTVTTQGLALTPRAVHPATVLTVYYVPGLAMPDVPVDPAYFERTAVDVSGAQGTLSTPKSGLGVIRVDWVDTAGDYHVVTTEWLTTSDGLSGLTAEDVLKVARSVT